ncbi:MAG: DUF4252 domain-containing protein, partial [Steroidobacteraceae bacterium]
MNRTGYLIALALLPMISIAQAARIKMPDFSGLADKASEAVDISLDKDMLKTAGSFMGGGKGANDAEFAELIKGLDGVYIKVFKFDKPGMYSARDIESMVKQVETQGWKKLLSVREKKGESVEMWMRDNSVDGGMFFVAAEATELVVINIAGKVDLETLRNLQGRMGVPSLP